MKQAFLIIVIISLLAAASCRQKSTPRPRGYFRIDFPEKHYHLFDSAGFPYKFEIADYAQVEPDDSDFAAPFWINIAVPANKAELHISYHSIAGNLSVYTEESRELAYKHTQKASAIETEFYLNPKQKVYGTIYTIAGNAASPMQFYLTDSTRHFLRGALYIRDVPNIDSLRPVIDFLIPDVLHLIETTKWKEK